MTQEQFVERYRYQLLGLLYDATTCRLTGEPLARMMQERGVKIDSLLRSAYAAASADEKPKPANGALVKGPK